MNSSTREHCYRCNRVQKLCLCSHITPIDSNTKYIILIHPKEARKIKNGTGRITHLSLNNSEIIVGVDFNKNAYVNSLIQESDSYVLYPSPSSINIATTPLTKSHKKRTIFILDATWACAKKMLRLSHNLQAIPHISFTPTQVSQFLIKEQPEDYCLSTIESTLKVLELLEKDECYSIQQLQNFLHPFHILNTMQLDAIELHANDENKTRFRRRS